MGDHDRIERLHLADFRMLKRAAPNLFREDRESWFTGAHVKPLTNADIRDELGLKDRVHVQTSYIRPAEAAGLVEMIIPGKPNSRLQKYPLTELGRAQLALLRRQS